MTRLPSAKEENGCKLEEGSRAPVTEGSMEDDGTWRSHEMRRVGVVCLKGPLGERHCPLLLASLAAPTHYDGRVARRQLQQHLLRELFDVPCLREKWNGPGCVWPLFFYLLVLHRWGKKLLARLLVAQYRLTWLCALLLSQEK